MSQLTPVNEEIGLSEEQIRSFWVDGFLVIDEVIPDEDVELLREAVASPDVMRDWRKQDYDTQTIHLLEITVKHRLMLELARSPRIL